LNAPIRAHLGAVINFQASTVRRAPVWLKNAGLEWAWRIKEEPHLWKRYLLDGSVLLRLLATHVVPLAMSVMWRRLRGANRQDLVIMQAPIDKSVKLTLVGAATSKHIGKATACLRTALRAKGQVIIDVSHAQWIDARFFGLLLMFRKQLAKQGTRLIFTGVSPRLERIFRLNGVKFLLAAESGM
jgi:N-acetylglucosaminyldiphosphoundecaprenol N-acetyl-beta-D-mannosaminyltransferase